MTKYTAAEIAALPDLADWRYVLAAIRSEFVFGSFAAAGEFVAAIGAAADAADHHPEVTLCYPGRVGVTLRTHVAKAVTSLDVDLARVISELAAESGGRAEPTRPQAVEIAIDTMDADRIRPFWAAVLGYVQWGPSVLVDPTGFGPAVWFQQMSEPRNERQRFHLDVSVPHEMATSRIDAALAAGGRLVTDEHARAWWVLADPDGNEACVCTWQDRD